MEKPADQTTNSMAVENAVDLQSPDRKLQVPRKRFVQSTLFPLKSHAAKVEICDKKEVAKKVEVIDGDEDDNGDDCCGSQGGKRKRGRKPKQITTPQKRGPKKVEVIEDDDNDDDVVCYGSQEGKRKRGRPPKNGTPTKRGTKKVTANGKDASIVDLDDNESPGGSPQQLKRKQRVSTCNGRTNGNKGASTAKLPTHQVATLQASQPVPDLWLEAKKTAEENSRLFAGKQMHPFFSSRKVGKKDQEATEVEGNGCLNKRKERNAVLGPIHVFENVKDDLDYIDWSNWSFFDRTSSKISGDQERIISSLENPVVSLDFDTFNRLNASGTSLLLKDLSSSQYSGAYEDTSQTPTSVSPIVVDEEGTPDTAYELLKSIEKDFDENKFGLLTRNVDHLNCESEHQDAALQERIRSYYLNRDNHPENSLWTIKYQPEKASEVCGNTEAVKSINDWLRLWHATDFSVSKRFSSTDKSLMSEDDYNSYNSDSDLENLAEASGLKNVLLVTGPVGCGKSAAIYACAKEQGFQVVEVNASDWRNGALLKQKFGEAVESHSLKRSQEFSQSKLNLRSSPAVFANRAMALDLNRGIDEVISLSEEEDTVGGVGMQYAGDQGEIKTLILFEDVDATLCEDRGFISTIQQLAETGKRPMILTSNSANPALPDNLDREEVCFMMPTSRELIHHIYLVCAAEKVNVQPHLIERCIQFCGGDIRKILTHLQFWCQNKRRGEDKKVRSLHSPLVFDLDAGHCTLPKLIPLDLPSSLSEFVEREIAKSLCRMRMEESQSLLEVIEEELGNPNMQNYSVFYKGETASIEAKKEAILRENFVRHAESDILAISNVGELSSSSGSPVAFTRRKLRRKQSTVLSDSEDEISNHESPAVADGICDVNKQNNLLSAVDSAVPIPYPTVDVSPNAFGDSLLNSGAVKTSETAHINHKAVVASCNESADHFVHHTEGRSAGLPAQHLESVVVDPSNRESANDLNSLNDQLLHYGERKMEANMNHFPIGGQIHQNLSTLDNLKIQSNDQAIHFGEANAVKAELGDLNHIPETSNHWLNLSSNELLHCGEAKLAVTRCLFPDTPHVDPVELSSSWNQSTDQLICCGEASMAEFQHQHLGTVNHSSQEVVDNSLNPLFDQFQSRAEATMVNIEHQQPETATVSPFSQLALDDSFNRSSEQLFCPAEANGQEIQHQHSENFDVGQHKSPVTVDVNFESLPAVGNSLKLLGDKVLQLSEENAEENQYEYSEATNGNHILYQCQSVDISRVPESTFVPETEANDDKDLPSGADLTEIVSPVTANIANSPVLRHKASEYMQYGSDINVNVKDEEMGDSQSENEFLEASTSGCQVMDECSRMDFYKRSKRFRGSKLAAKNFVQEMWHELRKTDLRQHFILENENALEVVELAYGMSNLISEADLLLHDCNLVTNDSVDQELGLGEETFTFGWHDQQVQMASAIAEHGYCFYAKYMDALQSKMGIDNRVHVAWEMLVSTDNSMALGKLLRLDSSRTESSVACRSLQGAAQTVDVSLTSEREICLQNIALSTVPLRSYLALRGNALVEYLSSLAHMSRSEASRLVAGAEKTKRRRVRLAKNYLCSGGLDLLPEDISMLIEYSSYGNIWSESTNSFSR